MFSQVIIGATVGPLKKALATNSTDSSYSAHGPSTTFGGPVSGTTVFVSGGTDGRFRQGIDLTTLQVWPFGAGANSNTGNVLILGWNHTAEDSANASTTQIWIPTIVCDVAFTVSSSLTGATGRDAAATDLFAHILTTTFGIAVLRQGTAAADVASFTCDVSGYQKWSIQFKTGTLTNCNAFVRTS